MIHDRSITESNAHPVVRRLVEVRVAWRLSIPTVAKRIGCHVSTLTHMENGSKDPSFKTLRKWAEVLGYEISIWPKESAK